VGHGAWGMGHGAWGMGSGVGEQGSVGVNEINPVNPACPVECVPRETRSKFLWGEAYSTGVNPVGFPGFYELPVSNLRIGGITFPWGGGAYFRLLPLSLFKLGVRRMLEKQNAYVFYMHPWELDPEQPRVSEASRNFKFRHYTNLEKTADKLSLFMNTFKDCAFLTCRDYINHFNQPK